MAVAMWLRVFDALTGVIDVSRRLRGGLQQNTEAMQVGGAGAGVPGTGQLEARLAGVVVAALKEAFDRDRTRLDLETAQIEAGRRRAEEALRLELRRQAADRAFAHLRLLVVIGLVIWLVSAVLSALVPGMRDPTPRLLLAIGWAALVGSLACGLAGHGTLSRWVTAAPGDAELPAGVALALMPWLMLSGLALTAGSLLLAL